MLLISQNGSSKDQRDDWNDRRVTDKTLKEKDKTTYKQSGEEPRWDRFAPQGLAGCPMAWAVCLKGIVVWGGEDGVHHILPQPLFPRARAPHQHGQEN